MSALALKQTTGITQSLNTLVLRDVMAALSLYEKKIHILELGRVCAQSLAFFNQFNCRLTVSNAIDTLCNKKQTTDQEAVNDIPAQVPIAQSFTDIIAPGMRFDLILAWDSLDYLGTTQRHELITYLKPYTHSHSLLHTFISSSQSIAEMPGSFVIHDSATVSYSENGAQCEHQPFTRYQIQKQLPELGVSKAILMRNGLQEIALRFRHA